jgi:pimeloyl-ACP methyl ester carboxylesterase
MRLGLDLNPRMETLMRRRMISTSLALAFLVLAFAFAVAGSASAAPSRPAKRPKPTIVLVHGAWADASSFNGEISRLRARGLRAIAPADPLRSLSGDAAYLASFLRTVRGPIVLVGHSYGGAVITDAATGNPNVKALVYLNAYVPDQGESVLDLASRFPGSLVPGALVPVPFALPNGISGVDLYLRRSSFRKVFAADVPTRRAALMAAEQRPAAQQAFAEPSGPPAWKTIPSWYLLGRQDRAVPPATQRFMARRAGARTTSIRSSHASPVSHPAAATRLILAAVKRVR